MKRFVMMVAYATMACSSSGGDQTVHASAVEHGRALFHDPKVSSSASNAFSCATCHRDDDTSSRIFAGGDLAGVTKRTRFWGGTRLDLLEAIDDCRMSFMDAPTPWSKDDPDARALYAYLASKPDGPAEIPFSVVARAPDLPSGDPARGTIAFDLACRVCHGAPHTGAGRLVSFAPRLPDDVDAQHAGVAPADRRLVYLRKIREGAFRDAAGSMPPFSKETLADEDVAGILAFLGQ